MQETASLKSAHDQQAMSTVTHCPYCAFQCGMRLLGPREQATVTGDATFPVNKGRLCIKGWTAPATLAHPERLLTPLARDASGTLVPVTWDEALTRVVRAFRDTQMRYGRDAIGIFGGGSLTNEKAYVLGNDHVTGLAFKDGSTLDCDMVVISAGIRPNVSLAQQAGLTVELGIVVNDDLSCSDDPAVYAIGECAQHRGRVYGLVAPVWEQAQVLADRLAYRNSQAVYQGSQVATRLKVMGVELTVMGEKEPAQESDEVVTYAKPSRGVYKKLIVRDGYLAGAILLGDGLTAPRLLQVFDRGEDLPENRAELLFPLAGESKALDVTALPDRARICNCNGVSKGKIISAVKAGHRSLTSVCDATRAGTGCGSCKPYIQALLELASDGLVVNDPPDRVPVHC